MQQVLVYADSLSWGIIPDTRQRFDFSRRWPGIMERELTAVGVAVRVIEDCLNGRRTAWQDPYKPGRNGLEGLEQRIEVNSPLSLVIVMLGTNDFQVMHQGNAWLSAQGTGAIIKAIRQAPVEPGMPIPEVLVVAPPPMQKARGLIAPKFEGAETRSRGLAGALQALAREQHCHFFDAGSVTASSRVDGVHLDEDQHMILGRSLATVVQPLL